jgi:hypothetical protein
VLSDQKCLDGITGIIIISTAIVLLLSILSPLYRIGQGTYRLVKRAAFHKVDLRSLGGIPEIWIHYYKVVAAAMKDKLSCTILLWPCWCCAMRNLGPELSSFLGDTMVKVVWWFFNGLLISNASSSVLFLKGLCICLKGRSKNIHQFLQSIFFGRYKKDALIPHNLVH